MKKYLYLLLSVLFLCVSLSSSLAKTTALALSDTIIYQTFSICEGDSVFVGNSVYTEPGVYQDTLLSSQAEDSTVITAIMYLVNSDLLPVTLTLCGEETDSLQVLPSLIQPLFTNDADLPLLDGVEAPVLIPLLINYFSPDQEIQSPGDIARVCLNIEHSWMHDLEIYLTCPSGQQVMLQNQVPIGHEVFLGEPYELDDSNPVNPHIPGTGWNYCWTSSAPLSLTEYSNLNIGQMITVPEGDYLPFDDFSNLVGCPLNGEWVISIRDQWAFDNGWVFNATIDFNIAAYLPIDVLWSTGETAPSIEVAEAGIYSIEVSSSTTCSITDTILVMRQELPPSYISGDLVYCFEEGATLMAGDSLIAGQEYLWSTGDTTFSIVVPDPGLYAVFVRNEAGCTLLDTIELFQLSPEIIHVLDSNYLRVLPLHTGTTYQWYLNGQPIPDAVENTWFYQANGGYQLAATFMGFTCLSDTLSVNITDLEEVQSEAAQINVFPNPTQGNINIESTLPMEDLIILNTFGQELDAIPCTGQVTLVLDFSKYPSGVYWILARQEDRIQVLKVTVTK